MGEEGMELGMGLGMTKPAEGYTDTGPEDMEFQDNDAMQFQDIDIMEFQG